MNYKKALLEAHQRILPYIHQTPILTSQLLNDISGAEIYFKCENFQKMGAFKMRGALNAILQLSDAEKTKGVVTHSSGNFAQAIALAAKMLGITAYIVMPKNAPKVKKEAVLGYGGIVIESDSTPIARELKADEVVKEKEATFIHPSNDIPVIIGQGTAALELLNNQPNLETVVTPVGGGGLLSGTALSAHYFGNNCKVYAGEPNEANDAFRSLKSGKIESNKTTNTIADGLRTQLGSNTFPIIQKYVNEIICVSEDEIIDAMKLLWERLKIVVEPSSAVAFAAVLKRKDIFQNKKIGVILSGGNVDLTNLPF
ncbi:MAG: pyridoxal-phosphate dependent enzyme [Lutibacter sp.]|uniref:pyridoxal-phosphate dependent enzyme n=1 Tax=Lutibacter sp. TaxID=1925666 RepID=UPI00299E7049|nr:pyridoxal-phosphate dependent enzyme [Lutibacter sp.]MDX1830020.1 pyridoxal-phosphate dependent enzyme [Lutibacter sp.]